MKKLKLYWMKSKHKETLAGAVFVGLLAMLFVFASTKQVVNESEKGFHAFATFNKSDGLMLGSDVRIAGIKIGRVTDMHLKDMDKVNVKLLFNQKIDLSIDSSVSIETDGLLGGKYIEILPGGDFTNMTSGDTFTYTQDSLVLTDLMAKINAYMRDKKEKKDE